MILAGLAAALVAGASTAEAQRSGTVRLPPRRMFNAHTVAAFGASVNEPTELGTLRTAVIPSAARDLPGQ